MAGNYYYIDVRHEGLNKYRQIRGKDPRVVEQKAAAQEAQWAEMWARKQEAERKRKAREEAAQLKAQKKELAAARTAEAQATLKSLTTILEATLDVDDAVDWNTLKDRSSFGKARPVKPSPPRPLPEPKRDELKYQPRFGLLDHLLSSRKDAKTKALELEWSQDHERWVRGMKKQDEAYAHELKSFEDQICGWENEEAEFEKEKALANAAIDRAAEAYLARKPEAIESYCDLVLSRSSYPEPFPKKFDVEYREASRAVVVDYTLPSPDDLPRLKEVKYIQSRDEFTEKLTSATEHNRLYDSLLYQTALRTIHELFEADGVDGIESVTFNGWVNSIDKRTGNPVDACILSVQAQKEEFEEINLRQVDPKACFKALKGVGSSKLHSLASVAPILQIEREDARFVEAYGVAADLDDSVNIAAMDWEDFEHLVRELFEQEFVSSGGEVNVTRASGDGGVDAIAIDPDPIRGGKIVIQAKRYTNVVDVAAVRDLYGTVVNEGATKGILVTTSDYGPDAYKFAKGKPLTLLNGANLLHLLAKHGHEAKIDIQEAKNSLAETDR